MKKKIQQKDGTPIVKKDGSATPYFTADDGSADATKTVYKQGDDGVKKMKGVHFDATQNRIHKH